MPFAPKERGRELKNIHVMLIPIKKKLRRETIEMALDVFVILRDTLLSLHKFDQEKEHFYAILLSRANKVMFIDEVAIGSSSAIIVTPKQVFRFAILKNAESIIIAHNHPSGNLQPSKEDKATTARLVEAGKIIGIPVLDSIIITPRNYLSFRGNKLM